MEKISGVYKIINTVTNECYVGSSKDVKRRWGNHKCPSRWKQYPNSKLYIDFQQYGLDKFIFEILEETDNLKEREQYYIGLLKPVYNDRRANGWDLERMKEHLKSKKWKEYQKKYHKKYDRSEKYKEYQKKYQNQICFYNGETLTLSALYTRFSKKGIEHPTTEAKKYLIER